MVALEVFAISSVYTGGSIVKYFWEKNLLSKGLRLDDGSKVEQAGHPISRFIRLSAEENKYDPPIYIGPHVAGTSVGIPIGGGSRSEMTTLLSASVGPDPSNNTYNWEYTDIGRTPCAVPSRYWLNTPDDIKQFFETNGIPQNIAPLRLPAQVKEIKIPSGTHVYAVSKRGVMGTNMNAVIHATAAMNTLHHSAFRPAVIAAVFTGVWLYASWNEYHQVEHRQKWAKKFGF